MTVCPHGRDRGEPTAAKRWDVTLYQGGFIIDAETEAEARTEALQCLAESLDLFVVREIQEPSDAA